LRTLVLDDAVKAAILAVQQHPQHNLLPYHRARVYAALGDLDTNLGFWRRGRLAIATAAYVLPFWRQAYPQDDRVDALLRMTERTLLGMKDAETLDTARDGLFSWLDRHRFQPYVPENSLPSTDDDRLIPFGAEDGDRDLQIDVAPHSAFFAAEATLAACIPILGIDVFSGTEISEHDREGDVLEPGQDAAWSAANACAGRSEYVDAERRLSYWMWWLTEAVPQAWSSTPPDGWTKPMAQTPGEFKVQSSYD
jgi:hypothetical protein